MFLLNARNLIVCTQIMKQSSFKAIEANCLDIKKISTPSTDGGTNWYMIGPLSLE